MCKYFGNKSHANILLSSIANLECTPSDRQMYPWGYMYPRLGIPAVVVCSYVGILHSSLVIFCFCVSGILLV